MALDAICLQAVVAEVAPQVQGLKIEKIQQPTRDQVILLLRGNRRLLLCASPSQPRLNLTALLRDNPSQPPMFCMLLRKHLSGGRILSMEQAPPGAGGDAAYRGCKRDGGDGNIFPDSGGRRAPF